MDIKLVKTDDAYRLPVGVASVSAVVGVGIPMSRDGWWSINIKYAEETPTGIVGHSVYLDEFNEELIPVTGEHLSDEWWVGRKQRDAVWEKAWADAIQWCSDRGLIPVRI